VKRFLLNDADKENQALTYINMVSAVGLTKPSNSFVSRPKGLESVLIKLNEETILYRKHIIDVLGKNATYKALK